MADPSSDDVSRLAEQLSHGDAVVRRLAAENLCRQAGDSGSVAVAIVQAAADPDEGVREWVVAALEELGPPLAEQCDELATLVGHTESDIAYWAATLLGRLGEDASPAVQRLADVLEESTTNHVRERIAWALSKIGPAAATATPALRKCAESDNPRLARTAARAIKAIDS